MLLRELLGGRLIRRILLLVAGFVCLFTSAACDSGGKPYEFVIRGGKVVDGTGNPWFYGDVAVRRDRIVEVARIIPSKGRREIDASGLVVAPGFIDIHSHSDGVLLRHGDAQSKIRQGVTTEVLGEGASAGPYQGKLSGRWSTLGQYLEALERSGIAVNVASYVGLDNIWRCVMGDSFERPTRAQLEEMKTLVAEAMQEGAFGLSSMLAAPPGMLATTDEIVTLCEVVQRYGGIYSSHIRNEGIGVFDAVREAIEIGRRAGVPVDIIHLKIADGRLWGRMDEVVALIDEARRDGVNVQANVYPYTRGHNDLVSIIPPWAHEGGRAKLLARLKDSQSRRRMKQEIREGVPGWYNHYLAVGGDWSRMLVSAGLRGFTSRSEGWTMEQIIAERTKDQRPKPDTLDVLFDMLVEQGGSISTIYAHHTEEDMNRALVQNWCSIGSDGSAYTIEGASRGWKPHPRSFGTFPRMLGVYVRERGLLRLEDAVRKMTSLNAVKLGLGGRGFLRPGYFADITVFDAERIIDKATYQEPFQYSSGIKYVIVNGQLVLDQGEHTGLYPGRALRRQRS